MVFLRLLKIQLLLMFLKIRLKPLYWVNSGRVFISVCIASSHNFLITVILFLFVLLLYLFIFNVYNVVLFLLWVHLSFSECSLIVFVILFYFIVLGIHMTLSSLLLNSLHFYIIWVAWKITITSECNPFLLYTKLCLFCMYYVFIVLCI